MDKGGVVRMPPLFGGTSAYTWRHTSSHPNGLLPATQFAQIALVVTEKVAFKDMQSKGFVQSNAVFAVTPLENTPPLPWPLVFFPSLHSLTLCLIVALSCNMLSNVALIVPCVL
jgi:hypothetical protein